MNTAATDKQVQLGCGTLILIALIVMIFSGGGDIDKLQMSIDELQTKVDRLEQKIDELSQRAEAPPNPPR
jgi:outer membrane murein-binding lipoprotein Lpp